MPRSFVSRYDWGVEPLIDPEPLTVEMEKPKKNKKVKKSKAKRKDRVSGRR